MTVDRLALIWTLRFPLVGMLVGGVTHELVHAVAARALGASRVSVSLRGARVVYAMPERLGEWRDYVIGLAPLLVGWSIAVAVWVTVGVPPLSDWWLFAGGWWAFLSLNTSVADLRPPTTAGGTTWFWSLSGTQRLVTAGLALLAVGAVGFWTVALTDAPVRLSDAVVGLAVALVYAGFGMFGFADWTAEN